MTKLVVLFTQGFADWECAHLMATGRAYFGFEIVLASPDGKPVTSSGGVTVLPDMALWDVDPDAVDGLVICGGTIWQSPDAPDIAAISKALAGSGKLVAGICDGVLALARTGVLDGQAHTGNDGETLLGVRGYTGGEHFIASPKAIASGRLVTASGLAPVSFMAEIIRALGHGGEALDAYVGMLAAEHG